MSELGELITDGWLQRRVVSRGRLEGMVMRAWLHASGREQACSWERGQVKGGRHAGVTCYAWAWWLRVKGSRPATVGPALVDQKRKRPNGPR